MKLDYSVIDIDNHYYENEASFTRHLPQEWAERAVQWVTVDGQRRMLVAGKLLNFVPNDTFDPVAKPGALDNWFRGINPDGKPMMHYYNDMESCQPAYRDRDQRLLLMDKQGIEQTLLFPSMACGIELALNTDIPALTASYSAFNRWLHDEWEFNFQDRLYAAPALTLTDLEWAIEELQWALSLDARTLYFSPGPVRTIQGWRSIADPLYDPFWEIVNQSGITVSFHQSATLYQNHSDYWVHTDSPGGLAFGASPMRGYMHDRAAAGAIEDTVASMICEGLFARFPNLRILSIENGSEWVALCLQRLRKTYGQMPWKFHEAPIETFKRHFWVSPYQEDDFAALRTTIGAENILFGSDFPHPEGLAEPTEYAKELRDFSDEEIHAVMRGNAEALIQRQPC